MGKITIASWSNFEDKKKQLEREQKMTDMVFNWGETDPPPCDISIYSDSGFRLFINPHPKATDLQKHKLLAWVVRHSGKRFERNIRPNDKLPYWINREIKIGKETIYVYVEDLPLGKKCRIVKTKKMVTVSEMVCD